ncbi:hypothetical protein KAR91_81665 [Candidatus Pacearchaeota archaeon]|nr:hypothetical protein [Candidatus Pacearchaeota archaeon]
MKKMYCPECGGEIMITRQVPEYSWIIKENGLERADNLTILDGPELLFHCDNDREHNIFPLGPDSQDTLNEFGRWMDEVEEFFNENVFPHL